MTFIRIWVLFAVSSVLWGKEPLALYLTWTKDPTSTMTIQWHTGGEKEGFLAVEYQELEETEWKKAQGSCISYPHSRRLIYTLELEGLKEDTTYRFRFEKEEETYSFKTMPSHLKRPIRFAVGGDAYFYYYLFRKMNVQIAKTDPDFIVVGGDIAYTHNHWALFKGPHWEEKRWQTFFSEWKQTMVGKEGRLIPLLPILGNHDLKKINREEASPASSSTPLFFQLFAMPEALKGYRNLSFGNYLSLLLLDTGHFSLIRGAQTEWLKKSLEESQSAAFRMAIYHVAAYPSVYNYKDVVPQRIRTCWVPLFEKYHLDTAFENHNHAYKRTFRIKEGHIDPSGVQYLGDGSWGVAPRPPKEGLWYIAKQAKVNCFWLVTMEDGLCTFESKDIKGKTIEKVESFSSAAFQEER